MVSLISFIQLINEYKNKQVLNASEAYVRQNLCLAIVDAW